METRLLSPRQEPPMKRLKFGIPAAILAMGLSFNLTTSYAKPEYTKKEKKACTVCHTTAKSKDLNDVGKCYKEKNSLQGCEAKK
jgi:hypothetical protein